MPEEKSIRDSIALIRSRLDAAGVHPLLLAATKTMSVERINEALKAGIIAVGENRVQEFRDKYDALSPYAEMHFIGTLQRNKAKYLVGRAKLIHSLDSDATAEEISRLAVARGVTQNVLIEVNIDGEEQKGGVMLSDISAFADFIVALPGVRLRGLMTVGAVRSCEEEYRPIFTEMKRQSDVLRRKYPEADELSMGMTHNYLTAAECGATIIRLGTAIFGERVYSSEKLV